MQPKFLHVCIPPLPLRRNMLTPHKGKSFSLNAASTSRPKKGLGNTQHKNPDYLHAQFSIWMDQSGTAGLNKSAVATGFTHDFPACVPPLPPVSCSHRFCAWNTNFRGKKTRFSDQIVCFCVSLLFLFIPKNAFFYAKWQLRGLRSEWLGGRGETLQKITKFRSKCSFGYVCFLHFWSLYM